MPADVERVRPCRRAEMWHPKTPRFADMNPPPRARHGGPAYSDSGPWWLARRRREERNEQDSGDTDRSLCPEQGEGQGLLVEPD